MESAKKRFLWTGKNLPSSSTPTKSWRGHEELVGEPVEQG